MSKKRERLPGHRDSALERWKHIRQFAVPRSMIERCRQAREAGDWRATCAAAQVDVTFDLGEVRRKFGGDVADRLADDLHHLAPDLVRWHLPRVDSHHTSLAPNGTAVLASYGDGDTFLAGPALTVHTPEGVFFKQRLRLDFGPLPLRYSVSNRVWWTGLRHLWDVRRGDELRALSGGGARAPFFEADGTPHPTASSEDQPSEVQRGADPAVQTEAVTELLRQGHTLDAFRAAGIDTTAFPTGWHGKSQLRVLTQSPVAPTQWTAAAAALRPVSNTWIISNTALTYDDSDPKRPHCRLHDIRDVIDEATRLPEFPVAARQRIVDLDLVAAGRLTPEDLHPLVRAALFPERSTVDRPVGPVAPRPPEPVRVRCGDRWHQVVPDAAGLRLPSHDETEIRRELAFAALSGEYTGCFKANKLWADGGSGLPAGLRRHRDELFSRMHHGDADGVLAMLDAGCDATVADDSGRTLLYHLAKVDHERLLPRLLAAGLDIVGRDHLGRTPLQFVGKHRPSPALVRALIDAGGADTADGWSWVKPVLLRDYEHTDPELAAALRSRVAGSGEQDA